MVFENKLKKKLKDGKKTAGAWVQIASPFTAEIFSNAGFDWLMIDMEHGPGDILTLVHQIHAMKGSDTVPLVRTPWNDFVQIKRILDAGASGVLVPYVNTKEEVEEAVRACKYPMDGIRGMAGSPRAPGYGQNSMNYLKVANEEIFIMTAVETPVAVDNMDEMLTVEGLDGIFIGPMDLATSMGYFGNSKHPAVQDAIKVIETKVLESGKVLATTTGTWEQAETLFQRGYQMLMLMADGVTLAKLANELVKKFKQAYPDE